MDQIFSITQKNRVRGDGFVGQVCCHIPHVTMNTLIFPRKRWFFRAISNVSLEFDRLLLDRRLSTQSKHPLVPLPMVPPCWFSIWHALVRCMCMCRTPLTTLVPISGVRRYTCSLKYVLWHCFAMKLRTHSLPSTPQHFSLLELGLPRRRRLPAGPAPPSRSRSRTALELSPRPSSPRS